LNFRLGIQKFESTVSTSISAIFGKVKKEKKKKKKKKKPKQTIQNKTFLAKRKSDDFFS